MDVPALVYYYYVLRIDIRLLVVFYILIFLFRLDPCQMSYKITRISLYFSRLFTSSFRLVISHRVYSSHIVQFFSFLENSQENTISDLIFNDNLFYVFMFFKLFTILPLPYIH